MKKKYRYNCEVACGYAVPLVISLLTIIVEFASPRCAIYRPRFGEETCFFSGNIHTSGYLHISNFYNPYKDALQNNF